MKPPTNRPERPSLPPATISDVRDGIAKLGREIGSLQGEVNELSNLIGRFAKGRTLRPVAKALSRVGLWTFAYARWPKVDSERPGA